jgi:triosephosphate isomerase
VLHALPGIPELLASRLLPEQVEQDAAWRAALLPGGSIAPQNASEFFKQVESQVRLCGASSWPD